MMYKYNHLTVEIKTPAPYQQLNKSELLARPPYSVREYFEDPAYKICCVKDLFILYILLKRDAKLKEL